MRSSFDFQWLAVESDSLRRSLRGQEFERGGGLEIPSDCESAILFESRCAKQVSSLDYDRVLGAEVRKRPSCRRVQDPELVGVGTI